MDRPAGVCEGKWSRWEGRGAWKLATFVWTVSAIFFIFFFSSQSLGHIGHYKLKCLLWIVSAALAPTLISQGIPEEKACKAALCAFSLLLPHLW